MNRKGETCINLKATNNRNENIGGSISRQFDYSHMGIYVEILAIVAEIELIIIKYLI